MLSYSICKTPSKIISLVTILILTQAPVIYAQSAYQGPAFGSIPNGAPVSTFMFEKIPMPEPEEKKIFNLYWEKQEPPYAPDEYNNTPAAAPMGSNIFIDPAAVMGRTVLEPPAVVNDFRGLDDPGSYIPPDPIIAAGPNHVVALDNSRMAIFDKKGNRLQTIIADVWFSNVVPSVSAFDPQIVYDHFAERWVQCWLHVDDVASTSYWLVSVSDDSDPFGDWCNYAFPNHLNGSTNAFNWGDYPKLGYDYQAIYISGRQFSFAGNFNYCKMRIIPKSELYAPGCGSVSYTDYWDFRDPNNPIQRVDGPPIAASHFDSTNTAYIVVDSPYLTSTFITLWTIENPTSTTPTVSAVNIPTTIAAPPPDANQLGGGTPRIDSGRRSYRNAVYKDGNIWTATAIAGGTANAYAFARYLRLDVNSLTAIEDVALGANGFYYLYPAVMVDEDNNLVMVFTRSADTEYAGAAYTGRKDSDPPGLSPSVLLKEGEANYVKTFGGTRNRWGDYMGIALDPVHRNQIWGFIQYAASPANTWGIWTGAFTYQYSISGIVKDAVTQNPLNLATLEVPETGRVIQTDSSGGYAFGSPIPNVDLNVGAFGYHDTTITLSLTLYDPDTLDILLPREIESTIAGQVKDASTGQGFYAELEFYAHGNPAPGPYATTTTDSNGFYSLQTIIGTYDIVVLPQIPYPVTTVSDVVLEATPLTFDIEILAAQVMLVNDDVSTDHESYFKGTMDAVGASYYTWRISEDGIPDTSVFNLFRQPSTVVWYTGNATTDVLSDAEQQSLAGLLDNGGNLLLTGQNIAETSSSGVLLSNYLGVTFNTNITSPIVRGIDGDPIGDGLVLSTVGGAGNQNSKDAFLMSGTGDSSLTYGTTPIGLAGIRVEGTPGDWKAVFLGFGLEGVNNTNGTRDTLARRILTWFDVVTGIEDKPLSSLIPGDFQLKQNYPNPFNPATTIQFNVAERTRVRIQIFNLLGQKVRTVVDREFAPGTFETTWQGLDDAHRPVSSGVYFYRMTTESGFSSARKLVLLK